MYYNMCRNNPKLFIHCDVINQYYESLQMITSQSTPNCDAITDRQYALPIHSALNRQVFKPNLSLMIWDFIKQSGVPMNSLNV